MACSGLHTEGIKEGLKESGQEDNNLMYSYMSSQAEVLIYKEIIATNLNNLTKSSITKDSNESIHIVWEENNQINYYNIINN